MLLDDLCYYPRTLEWYTLDPKDDIKITHMYGEKNESHLMLIVDYMLSHLVCYNVVGFGYI